VTAIHAEEGSKDLILDGPACTVTLEGNKGLVHHYTSPNQLQRKRVMLELEETAWDWNVGQRGLCTR